MVGRRGIRYEVPRGRLAPYDMDALDRSSVTVATRLDQEIADNLRACRTRNFVPRPAESTGTTVRIEIGAAASSMACQEPAPSSMAAANGPDSPPLVPVDPVIDEINRRLLEQDDEAQHHNFAQSERSGFEVYRCFMVTPVVAESKPPTDGPATEPPTRPAWKEGRIRMAELPAYALALPAWCASEYSEPPIFEPDERLVGVAIHPRNQATWSPRAGSEVLTYSRKKRCWIWAVFVRWDSPIHVVLLTQHGYFDQHRARVRWMATRAELEQYEGRELTLAESLLMAVRERADLAWWHQTSVGEGPLQVSHQAPFTPPEPQAVDFSLIVGALALEGVRRMR